MIHKSSVNMPTMREPNASFPSPFFVFGEKIRTKMVSCKQMTMVTPLHLMVFASRKIDLLPSGVVRLDNWINLAMPARQAALVAALRPAMETLVMRAAADPEEHGSAFGGGSVTGGGGEHDAANRLLLSLLRELLSPNGGRHGMEPLQQQQFERRFAGGGSGGDFEGPRFGTGPTPPKMGRF